MKEITLLKSTSGYIALLIFLAVLLVTSILVAVTIGSTSIPIEDVYQVIVNELSSQINHSAIRDIIIYIRLPRLILAIAVGMGLAVSGVVMQAVVRNPLADPYILGISSGASLGATSAALLGVGSAFGSNYLGVMGCIGAFAVSMMVLVLSNIGGRSNSIKLLLSGMALSSLCSAFSSFIVYFADDKEGMMSITYWLMGSLAGAEWSVIAVVLPIVFLCTIFLWSQHRILNLMLLGDEVAVTLGTELHRYRNLFLLISALMIGFIVYASGMIGFVGLIIPHFVRFLVGTDHKKLLPISALAGALLLVWADVLSRIIIPQNELPIGILISMVGAPCFIYLMAKKSYGFGGNN
ncbi:FecCD family ABC transporter permease [Candidatus Epulonipiscium viviparus]|uniref:FecCD family ABC transporter permease n=1 Tax=Candidatus Epulonipiscium viviparus TaxID=420336 RepID=UPI0027380D44|nr:iron ABC transporter permease [Candidatus Epulopiscium viviparus]